MTITTTLDPQNKNNPTKEILASSGIYNGQVLAQKPYADDKSDQTIANTGINTTTTKAPSASIPVSVSGFILSSGNYFIDDMLIFNNYIHHTKNLMFNPQEFLKKATTTFNIYSTEYR